jgi:hypothetical protein
LVGVLREPNPVEFGAMLVEAVDVDGAALPTPNRDDDPGIALEAPDAAGVFDDPPNSGAADPELDDPPNSGVADPKPPAPLAPGVADTNLPNIIIVCIVCLFRMNGYLKRIDAVIGLPL